MKYKDSFNQDVKRKDLILISYESKLIPALFIRTKENQICNLHYYPLNFSITRTIEIARSPQGILLNKKLPQVNYCKAEFVKIPISFLTNKELINYYYIINKCL